MEKTTNEIKHRFKVFCGNVCVVFIFIIYWTQYRIENRDKNIECSTPSTEPKHVRLSFKLRFFFNFSFSSLWVCVVLFLAHSLLQPFKICKKVKNRDCTHLHNSHSHGHHDLLIYLWYSLSRQSTIRNWQTVIVELQKKQRRLQWQRCNAFYVYLSKQSDVIWNVMFDSFVDIFLHSASILFLFVRYIKTQFRTYSILISLNFSEAFRRFFDLFFHLFRFDVLRVFF